MSKRIITLGTWESEPIEWLVLKEEGFASLVISKYALFSMQFSNFSNEWYNSDIRKYLNSTFFNKAFSESEKRKIFNVKLNDVNTKDSIFIPSVEEVKSFLSSDERKFGNGSRGVVLKSLSCGWDNCSECCKANKKGYSNCWTLRTKYNSNSNSIYRTTYDSCINNFPIDKYHGIRPAMWIKEK